MRIPLDYYRILGLPIQANAQQLSQAYRDRALQLPRREYSEAAITSRKQLFDEAYAVLSDPEKREVYDESFLTTTYEQAAERQTLPRSATANQATEGVTTEPHTPSIEIKDEQFVGALLILQELGEYELVLKLGQPLLSSRDSIGLDKGRWGDPQLVRPDIVLTIALSCLELGREQWQQGQYENAANSLSKGQELLLQESVFPAARGEIQADLYKLRPYRILELLALPEENIAQRQKGLQLLQEMLEERGGIDGNGDDQSGLSIDDFLRFIQQLRSYLSVAQQQALFETEARRPSAVATYLAVYALLARGFAQRQPALIARAKQMLMRLGRRQDVHLEQAVCALLLGQTEEASKALELSQEYEPLAFIREHSQGAPDLLPGLCLYGERWLQTSVFPHFRDLAEQKASLKEYFADEQVQAYLEDLPEPSEENGSEWAVVQSGKPTYASTNSIGASEPAAYAQTNPAQVNGEGAKNSQQNSFPAQALAGSKWAGREKASSAASRRAAADNTTGGRFSNGVSTLPAAQRIAPTSEAVDSKISGLVSDPSARSRRRKIQPRGNTEPLQRADSLPGASSSSGEADLGLPPNHNPSLARKSTSNLKVKNLVVLAISGLVGLVLLGLMISWLQKTLKSLSAPVLEGEQPLVELARPPVAIPEPGSGMVSPDGLLTNEIAQEIIQTWLSAKSLAFGRNHQIDQLEKVLVEPALSARRKSAQAAKQNNSYWRYKHNVVINSVETNQANSDIATVEAAVTEEARFYQGGQLSQGNSYSENLGVRYDLVRKDDQWFIKDMAVIR